MKEFFLFFATLPALLCGCSSFEEFNDVPALNPISELRAGFADESRTYVENGTYLRWHADDRLTAFYGNTLNRQYKFNGKTGDNSGTFSLVPSGELGTGNAFDRIYALYPYSETATITDEGVISLTLPAEQSYAENSFGKDANTMIAVTENLEDTFLSFKNACGYLKLKLYNTYGVRVKSIEIRGNNNEKIAGSATATIEFGGVPTLAMAEDATSTITLDCGEGVALGTTAETATEFWVAIPETTFTKGFTMLVTDSNNTTLTKTTDKKVVIGRNTILPMEAVELTFEAPTTPASNEIWYTATAKVEPTWDDATMFGANAISNVFDAETQKGIITFDGKVTMIGDEAFYQCTKLTSVTIPDSVTTIGHSAFSSCSSLTSVTIPNSVTTIGDGAFRDCTSLSSVTIPDSVTTIGDGAFRECTSLKAFYSKFASADNRCLIVDGELIAFAPAGLTEYTIPDSVTAIGYYAFGDCTSLTSVAIPDSVTTIGYAAFYHCESLTSVTIPDKVTSIGYYAFYYCRSLTSMTIPEDVTTIGSWAFYYCRSLKKVYCKPTTPPSLGSSVFDSNASGRRIYVPTASVDAYKAKWSNCASAIYPYTFTE